MKYLLSTLAFLSLPVVAGDAPLATVEATEKQSIKLFNGHDLSGWRMVGGKAEFTVEDGCIVGTGDNLKGNSFLRTEATYQDFEFTYEFKFDTLKGNSGVMFRANQRDGNGRVFGYQCEGDNNPKRVWTGGIYDEARRGWLHPTKSKQADKLAVARAFTAQGKALFKWDDWNSFKIRCQGNRIQIWLNGELRTDFTDTDPEHDTREGFFGLQVHSGASCKVRWRNIAVKEL